MLIRSIPAPESDGLLVVDIDRNSFRAAPGENWQRAQTAELVTALAAAKPAAIAFDLVFSSNCDPGDTANRALAAALGTVPSVLGFLIGEATDRPPGPVPELAVQRPVAVPDLWFVEGTESSCPIFQERAAAAASAFLVGDADSLVRRIQAYAVVGNAAYPEIGRASCRERVL